MHQGNKGGNTDPEQSLRHHTVPKCQAMLTKFLRQAMESSHSSAWIFLLFRMRWDLLNDVAGASSLSDLSFLLKRCEEEEEEEEEEDEEEELINNCVSVPLSSPFSSSSSSSSSTTFIFC
jgi:hypothetical protein